MTMQRRLEARLAGVIMWPMAPAMGKPGKGIIFLSSGRGDTSTMDRAGL